MKKFDLTDLLYLIPVFLTAMLVFGIYMSRRTDGEYKIPSSSIDHVIASYPLRGSFNTFAVTIDGDTIQFNASRQYDGWGYEKRFLTDTIVVAPVTLEKVYASHSNGYRWDKEFDVYSWR